jgi:hypothetical protein
MSGSVDTACEWRDYTSSQTNLCRSFGVGFGLTKAIRRYAYSSMSEAPQAPRPLIKANARLAAPVALGMCAPLLSDSLYECVSGLSIVPMPHLW